MPEPRRRDPVVLPAEVWINRPKPPQPVVGKKSDPVGSPESHEVQPGKGMGTPHISAAAADTISSSTLAAAHYIPKMTVSFSLTGSAYLALGASQRITSRRLGFFRDRFTDFATSSGAEMHAPPTPIFHARDPPQIAVSLAELCAVSLAGP
jgi:hypothetical protein